MCEVEGCARAATKRRNIGDGRCMTLCVGHAKRLDSYGGLHEEVPLARKSIRPAHITSCQADSSCTRPVSTSVVRDGEVIHTCTTHYSRFKKYESFDKPRHYENVGRRPTIRTAEALSGG